MASGRYGLFVSFAEADREWVEGFLLPALREAGVRFITEDEFRPGAPRSTEIERAVAQSDHTLLVLSPDFLAPGFAAYAATLAQAFGAARGTWPVLPLILREVDLPPALDALTPVRATSPERWDAAVARVLGTVGRRREGSAAAPPPCPYPGMRPFPAELSGRFFGREPEVADLVERVRVQRLLVVIGPSGSGKSSLVLAGLLPTLAERDPDGWDVNVVRPRAGLAALRNLVSARPGPRRRLVVVDQLEEALTSLDPADEEALAGVAALAAAPSTSVVCTLRADFYGELIDSPLWPLPEGAEIAVSTLREQALERAIAEPAKAEGVVIESRLVERLKADVAGAPGPLPFLQEALIQLWGAMRGRLITFESYSALGRGGRSGLETAIARRADGAIGELDEGDRAIARRLLVRLVQFGEGRPDTRRQQPEEALRSAGDDGERVADVVKRLADARILTLSGEGGGGRRVDLSHEALITGWPALQRWVTERRDAEDTRRRLEGVVGEWARLGRGAAGLLDEVEQREAADFLASPDAAVVGVPAELPALLRASRRRSRRRKVVVRISVVTAIAALLAIVVVAVSAQRSAADQQDESRSRELAARADAELANDPELSLLLAREALAVDSTPQAESALRTALNRSRIRASLPISFFGAKATFAPGGTGALVFDGEFGVWRWSRGERGLHRLSFGDVILPEAIQLRADARAYLVADGIGVQVVDPPSGRVVRTVSLGGYPGSGPFGAPPFAYDTEISRDGRRMAVALEDGTVRAWDLKRARAPVGSIRHRGFAADVAFSADGNMLASAGGQDGVVRLWNLQTDAVRLIRTSANDSAQSVAFAPDGSLVAAGYADGTLRVWSLPELSLRVERREHRGFLESIAFTSDGAWIATAGEDGVIRVARTTDADDEVVMPGPTGDIGHLEFSGDDRHLLSVGPDDLVRVFEWQGPPRRRLRAEGGEATALAWAPGSRALLVGTREGRIDALAPDSGARIWTKPVHGGAISSLETTPDGRLIASSSADGTVALHAPDRDDPARRARLRGGAAHNAVFSADGRLLATGDEAGRIRVWAVGGDPPRARLLRTLQPPQPPVLGDVHHGTLQDVFSVAFVARGERLLFGGVDAVAEWPWRDGEREPVWTTKEFVYDLDLAPAERAFAVALADGSVRILSRQGEVEQVLRARERRIYSVDYHPGGELLAAGGDDGFLRVWGLATGKAILAERLQPKAIREVRFSPDGRSIAAAGDDGSTTVIRCYECDPIDEVDEEAAKRATRDLTPEEEQTLLGRSG